MSRLPGPQSCEIVPFKSPSARHGIKVKFASSLICRQARNLDGWRRNSFSTNATGGVGLVELSATAKSKMVVTPVSAVIVEFQLNE